MNKAVVALALSGLVGMALFYLYQTRTNSVLFEFSEPGDPLGPVLTILHPFRDRAPEREARRFLRDLTAGRIDDAVSRIQCPEVARDEILTNEMQHPMRDWKLTARNDGTGQVVLRYDSARGDSSEYEFKLWISLAPVDSEYGTEWMIVEYDAWY